MLTIEIRIEVDESELSDMMTVAGRAQMMFEDTSYEAAANMLAKIAEAVEEEVDDG